MKYDGYIFQNGIVVKLLDIFSTNQHFALLHIIEAGDQLNHGTFTGTRLSHKSHAFPVIDFEVDTLQYIGLAVIGKSDIAKFNIVILGKVRSTLINRNIQDFFGLGNSVQYISKISPQFLQGADFRQIHGTYIDEQQKCAGRQ